MSLQVNYLEKKQGIIVFASLIKQTHIGHTILYTIVHIICDVKSGYLTC